jgi:hypothetical protein
MNTTPILIHADFSMSDNALDASLRLLVNCEDAHTTVIREAVDGTTVYDLLHGETSEAIDTHDGETITINVRQDGLVIAGGIFETSGAYYDNAGSLLIPRCTFNLDFSQSSVVAVPAPLSKHLARAGAILDGARTEIDGLVGALTAPLQTSLTDQEIDELVRLAQESQISIEADAAISAAIRGSGVTQ